MPGCGKTTIGEKLAEKLQFTFIDMDKWIEEETGKSITQIFEEEGEEKFREMETNILRNLVKDDRLLVISTGGGAPCFSGNMELINSIGKSFYLKTPIYKLLENLKTTSDSRPLLRGDLEQRTSSLLEAREPIYMESQFVIDNQSSPQDALQKILALLKN